MRSPSLFERGRAPGCPRSLHLTPARSDSGTLLRLALPTRESRTVEDAMSSRALETLNTPLSPLLRRSDQHSPRVMSPAVRRSSRSGRENAPPADPNIQKVARPASPSVLKKSPTRVRNPAKILCGADSVGDATPEPSDSSVKVLVRIRPAHAHEKEEERIAKVSDDSLVVGERTFTVGSVFGPESTQEDIFQVVGLPLVQNSLAGFNTSILSYGETGSGKTYTMWGPLSSMVEDNSINTYQGIAPRIFHTLFEEIQKKQDSDVEKQISFQCRCSFLEIHNEQINDLLDPSQRNLQIRDDTKNGFYIENLTEEYVTKVQDVTQIIVKGLSSRRVGMTSINSKSSRSHIILTCVIESWCKGTSNKAFSSSRISRITLVDLAGSDRNKLNDGDRHCIKEGRHVLKSLSSLGKLVNILAEVSHSGKQRSIPYRDSCLTYLLRESLGGNVKLAFICTISPDARCKSGTLSTLRFAHRAKCIQNKAIVNEITEDYVNDLSDQIRHLKEELIRERSYQDNSLGASNGYFRTDEARKSLNLLRVSLNRSLLALPQIVDDSDEEVDINEDVSQLCEQLGDLQSALEENPNIIVECTNDMRISYVKDNSGADNRNGGDGTFNFENENAICMEESLDEVNTKTVLGISTNGSKMDNHRVQEELLKVEKERQLHQSLSTINLSVMPCSPLAIPHEPTSSESPKASNSVKKNFTDSSNLSGSKRNGPVSPSMKENLSVKDTEHIRSSLQSRKSSPTDSLAASLHRGLQVIEYHQRNSGSKRTSLAFSFDHLIAKPREATESADVYMQASPNTNNMTQAPRLSSSSNSPFICTSCRQREIDSNMQIIPISDVKNPEENYLLRNNGGSLTDILGRKNELEKICEEQAARINQLNNLIMQYKNEGEANSTMKRSGGETKEFQHENYNESPEVESEKNSDVPEAGTRLKECQREQEEEDRSASMVVSLNDSLLQLIRNGPENSASRKESEDFEKERQRWTESESKWICLTEELRIDLESHRRLAEKRDSELALEKKCSAELDDALQRAILGHARIIEHYAELQEKHNDLVDRYRRVMEGVAQVKKAAAKAGAKGAGSAFAEALAAEVSALRVDREKETAYLKRQNKGLRIQLKDTAEAVHAAGELLVRLREAEEAVLVSEAKSEKAQQETENLRKQMEKLKKKHAMEMVTVKHYMAESRLPESALEPLFRSDGTENNKSTVADDDQSWRSAFVPSYR